MLSSIVLTAALLSVANAHSVFTSAVGDSGVSVGFQVNPNLARNCTGISPCQQDTTIIRDAEIAANIVNECGRTELTGNIDVGENTEAALASGAITKVKAGSLVTVTLHQVNADGAGPYSCDIDETGNAGIISQNLTVTNNVPGVNGLSQAKTTNFNITVAMPTNMKCTGASTGNVCTVRCRNNAVAGPFGGCFAVQQTDVQATSNTPNQISTAQKLSDIDAQIAQNQVDLAAAVAANQVQGTPEQQAAVKAAEVLGGVSVTTKASPVQTLAVVNVNGAATAATTSAKASKAAKATGTAKAGNTGAKNGKDTAAANNNKARSIGLRWAKRMIISDDE